MTKCFSKFRFHYEGMIMMNAREWCIFGGQHKLFSAPKARVKKTTKFAENWGFSLKKGAIKHFGAEGAEEGEGMKAFSIFDFVYS